MVNLWIECKHDFRFHREWQSSLRFVILNVKNSSEIVKMTRIGHQRDFTIKSWSETWFHEMLNIPFMRAFSVNLNSLFHHYHKCVKRKLMTYTNDCEWIKERLPCLKGWSCTNLYFLSICAHRTGFVIRNSKVQMPPEK